MTTPEDVPVYAVAAAVILMAALGGILAGALLRAASKRRDAMVVVSLSLLTLVATMGYIATEQEGLLTLAGAGVGALAGAVTHLFGADDERTP